MKKLLFIEKSQNETDKSLKQYDAVKVSSDVFYEAFA